MIKVKTLEPGQYISRELSLIKVTCHASNRGDVMRVAELMGARIIDVTTTCLTLEFADTAERTDTLLDLLRPFGFKEIVRAGAIAIEKGEKTTTLKK